MGVTIHVNGKSNSLVHKGSMGIAKSTLPDVCKTPSPGGPVPIPYPVIVSMSSDLKKGTKTVKVDGKKMAAVKGSEFSRCMGDESGTAGGVKSSTNMKEATWILYSFDVKLDGKNACRLSDKMMMNHQNTACLAGEDQIPVAAQAEPFVVNIDCKKKMNDPRPGKKWDKCMCQQLCAKIKKMDQARKKGMMKPTPGARKTADYGTGKSRYIKSFMERVKAGKGVRRQFIHKCAADKYINETHPKNPTEGGHNAPFNADHMHEAALGGNLLSMSNFKMMDKRVNQSISFQSYDPEGKHKGKPIKAHSSCNCPHGPK